KKKKKKTKTGEHFKQRFKRTFNTLLEEAQQEVEEGEPTYATANAPPSRFPDRHFCAVCGYPFVQLYLVPGLTIDMIIIHCLI
ncbi:hypothetical protein QZH41_020306, partial [Actinostola sp. cb2023]